ncbi:MAG: SRPBCC domain-containing protein [Pseudomonadota bacterium]
MVKRADGRIDRTPASLVTVTFEAEGEGTRLRLRHESIQTKSGREGVTIGWRSSLAALGDVVRRREPG